MLKTAITWSRGVYERVFKTELLRRIVTNSGYLVTASGFTAALGMARGILEARMLGPAGMGLLAAVATFTNVANRFTSFRIDELVVRYVRLYEERGARDKAAAVYKFSALLEMGGALAAFLLILWLAPVAAGYIVHDPSTSDWFVLYGVVVLVNFIYDSSAGLLKVFNKFRSLAVFNAIQSMALLGLVLGAYLNGKGLYEVLLAYVASKGVGALGVVSLALITAGREWGRGWWRTPLRTLADERRSLLGFAFSTNASATISLVAKDSESLWVSSFLGVTATGYYSLALTLTGWLQIPVAPLPDTTYPELSREIARGQWQRVRYILGRGTMLAAVYSLPVTLGLIIFGQPLIELVYTEKFLPSYPALVILLAGYLFVNLLYWNRIALLALNRPLFPTLVNFAGMVLKVAGIFLLVPRFGYLAFAALLAGYYVFTISLSAGRAIFDIRARQAAAVSAST